jgi:signal peptidase I
MKRAPRGYGSAAVTHAAPAPRRRRSLAGRIAMWALVTLGAVIALGWLFVGRHHERFRIPSESMAPTVTVGDKVVLNHNAYGEDGPALQDVVIINPPVGASSAEGPRCGQDLVETQMCAKPTPGLDDVKFVKRVVGLPGDRLALDGGIVIRNGEKLHEPYAQACEEEAEACDFAQEIEVPPDHFFMLGDNRGASDDSRFWGPVPARAVLGRVERCSLVLVGCDPVR